MINDYTIANKISADIQIMALPDKFIQHGATDKLMVEHGLTYENLHKMIGSIVKQ